MRSPLTALAALPVLAAPLVAAPQADAATCTAPELTSAWATPRTVVVGVAQPKGLEVTVNLRKHGCRINSVTVGFFTPDGYTELDLHQAGTADGITTYEGGGRITPGSFRNADAGRWEPRYYVNYGKNKDLPAEDGAPVKVVRAAKVTANAAPEPVRKGKTVTVRGKLTRANWNTLRYNGYGSRPVKLQFRAKGGSWHTVKTVTSSATGAVRGSTKATRDGCFRFVFRGNGTSSKATSGADCVDVR